MVFAFVRVFHRHTRSVVAGFIKSAVLRESFEACISVVGFAAHPAGVVLAAPGFSVGAFVFTFIATSTFFDTIKIIAFSVKIAGGLMFSAIDDAEFTVIAKTQFAAVALAFVADSLAGVVAAAFSV